MFIPLGDDGPRPRLPIATLSLVGLNILVFVVQWLLPTDDGVRLLYSGGAVPYEIAHFSDLIDGNLHPAALVAPPFTIVTSMFLHGGIEHLVGNIWFLWVFGDNVEGAMGSVRFLFFYMMMGILAAVAQVAMTPGSQVPIVGASGAIAGVLGAYFLLFPRAKVQVLLFLVVLIEIVVVPAFFALGIWFLWQVLSGKGESSVAIWAHVGGFLVGAACCKVFTLGVTPPEPRFSRPLMPPWLSRPRLAEIPMPVPAPVAALEPSAPIDAEATTAESESDRPWTRSTPPLSPAPSGPENSSWPL